MACADCERRRAELRAAKRKVEAKIKRSAQATIRAVNQVFVVSGGKRTK
jgi:hypothetical protein